MTRPTIDDAELGELITRTLEAKARGVVAPEAPFEPVPRRPASLPTMERPRRRAAVAAVATIVAVAGAVGAAYVVGDPGPGGPGVSERGPDAMTDTAPSTAPPPTTAPAWPAPDGVLAPSSAPAGLTLWAAQWAQVTPDDAPVTHEQLFTGGDGAGMVVAVQPSSGPGGFGGDPVTVRGTTGGATPAKEFAETDTTIMWTEADVDVSATFTGMTRDAAVAFLDTLTWRSDDRSAGFAAPAGGDLALGPESNVAPAGPALTAQFVYASDLGAQAPGEGRQVSLRTSTAPVAGTSAWGLQVRMHATTRDDGAREAFDAGAGVLTVVWPDGRAVTADAYATPVSREELRAVVDSVAPVDSAGFARIAGRATQNMVDAMPVVSTADLPSATVTVRGSDGVEVVCLTPAGGDEVCPSLLDTGRRPTAAQGEVTLLTASVRIDGTWWVVGVSSSRPTARVDDTFSATPSPELAGERGVGEDGRLVVVVRPPTSAEGVLLGAPDATGAILSRPA